MSAIRYTYANEGAAERSFSESWLSRHTPYILLLVFLYWCNLLTLEIFDDFFYFYRVLPLIENAILALLAIAGFGVVVRLTVHAVRRVSLQTVMRTILGEPTWWRTWYPRALRTPDSVWDRMPLPLKTIRTLVWLELLLLPAGFFLAIFVIPTFQAVYASIGVVAPLAMRMYLTAVEIGSYALPAVFVAALALGWKWRTKYDLPLLVVVCAFFAGSREFWQDTDARMLLRS